MLWLCVLGCTDDRLPNEDFLLPHMSCALKALRTERSDFVSSSASPLSDGSLCLSEDGGTVELLSISSSLLFFSSGVLTSSSA